MKKLILIFLAINCSYFLPYAQKQEDINALIKKYSDIFEWKIKPQGEYWFAYLSDDNILTVYNKKKKYGYMTLDKEFISPCQWGTASIAFDCGVGIVGKKPKGWLELIDLNNNGASVPDSRFYWSKGFVNGYCAVSLKGTPKWGVIDCKGKLVTDYTYGDIKLPRNYKDIIDGKSKDLLVVKEFKNSGMGWWGLMTYEGEWKTEPLNAEAYSKKGDFYPVSKTYFKNDKGMFDENGNQIIPFEYQDLHPLNDEYILARKKDEKWGILNKKNETVVPFEYDLIVAVKNTLKVYYEKGKEYGYIHMDNVKIEKKGELNRDPILYYYGSLENNKPGSFSYQDYKDAKVFGICKLENDVLKVEIEPKFGMVYLITQGDKFRIIYNKKISGHMYYGMLNEKYETLIDANDKEFTDINFGNAKRYHTIAIENTIGVAKIKI